ncbi:MAG: hypothetical protein ACHREM_07810 [Polyangiales bacterium]
MTFVRACSLLAVVAASSALAVLIRNHARAATAPTTVTSAADERLLGSVDVSGAAAAPSQRLAIVPLLTQDDAESVTQQIVRRDLERSGEFDLASVDVVAEGPFSRTKSIDTKAWSAKGIDVLVRVTSEPLSATARTFTAEAWLSKSGLTAPSQTRSTTFDVDHVRLGAHSLSDALLGLTTGRAGTFESRMVFARTVDGGRQVHVVDADGFGLRGLGPASQIALSPTFGPADETYYSLAIDSGPFRLVHGNAATPVVWPALSGVGGVLGVAFSSDRKRVVLTTMRAGVSTLWAGDADGTHLAPTKVGPFATHPVLGPLGKIAWVAGAPPRVFVDGKAISPNGIAASAPTFCDSPKGLFVVFGVEVLGGSDLVATDVDGHGLLRLTQGQGNNRDAACSPDGRLVAFFSTRTSGAGPGLYVMPLATPRRAQSGPPHLRVENSRKDLKPIVRIPPSDFASLRDASGPSGRGSLEE